MMYLLEIILIIFGLVYAVAALMGIVLYALFTSHSYNCCWLETLLIVLAQGMTAPIWFLANSLGYDIDLGRYLENKILCCFDPVRKYLKPKR